MIKEKTYRRVFEHAAFVDKNLTASTRVLTALFGSQNYSIDTENSDVDTRTLVVPNFHDLILNKSYKSQLLFVPPSEEHAEIMDIRQAFAILKKQNPTALEILFTPYIDLNDGLFMDLYTELFSFKEDIARYNPHKLLCAAVGNFFSRCSYFEKRQTGAELYNAKALCHMLREKEFMYRYFKEESFEDCLTSRDTDFLASVRRGELPLEDAVKLYMSTKEWVGNFLDKEIASVPNEYNKTTGDILDSLLINTFAYCYSTTGGSEDDY